MKTPVVLIIFNRPKYAMSLPSVIAALLAEGSLIERTSGDPALGRCFWSCDALDGPRLYYRRDNGQDLNLVTTATGIALLTTENVFVALDMLCRGREDLAAEREQQEDEDL
jgi:hypothetical protein